MNDSGETAIRKMLDGLRVTAEEQERAIVAFRRMMGRAALDRISARGNVVRPDDLPALQSAGKVSMDKTIRVISEPYGGGEKRSDVCGELRFEGDDGAADPVTLTYYEEGGKCECMTPVDYSKSLRSKPFGGRSKNWTRISGLLAVADEDRYVQPGHIFSVRHIRDGSWEICTVWNRNKTTRAKYQMSVRAIKDQAQKDRLQRTGAITYEEIVDSVQDAYGDQVYIPTESEFWAAFGLELDPDSGEISNPRGLV